MNSIIRDLRLSAARFRARSGQFAAVAAILVLGIGASTAIFTLVDATLFHPFDLPAVERLVRVNAVDSPSDRANPKNHSNSSFPVYADYRSETAIFSGLAAYADTMALHGAEGDGQPMRIVGAVVSGNSRLVPPGASGGGFGSDPVPARGVKRRTRR